MSRKSVQEERRLQIFSALRECLLQKPFNEISTREIARLAEVNHGMLYYFFNSKEDILLQFIDFTIDRYKTVFYEWLNRHLKDGKPDKEFIKELFSFIIQKITMNKDLSKIFIEIWSIASHNTEVKDKLRSLYNDWEQIALEMFTNAGIDNKTSRLATTAMVTSFEGISLFSILQDDRTAHLSDVLKWHRDRIIDLMP
ncbi:MAG TPA: TetR/AcrR family transcriptional regulator [Spirochaetota bacterium]|nr:TetR/AcrR family transcriptional regulator [Spirochaetota bacterium]HPI90719.1 TetR/AcrR family transcriptional regulator [Spirochaetota bacterium]HPR49740.1 TetR/AcrR family transcriptional regulator [Spirochaetota bacterium]